MSAALATLSLEDAAKQAAGNWRQFECFSWRRGYDLNDAHKWAIFYTRNRDGGLSEQSNDIAIHNALLPFTKGDNPDVVEEHHTHWAVGWVDGFSIRVFKRGRITKAFKIYHELAQRMADYPLLDEDDYYSREYGTTLANIADSAWRLKHEYDLPRGWESAVYSWLADNDCSAIENHDDRGGYPDQEQLKQAFDALGYKQAAGAR
jgi:hypothetical protein